MALFGQRGTEFENGSLVLKTSKQSRAQIIIQEHFFSSVTSPRRHTKRCFYFQVIIVYWWLSITSSVIRLWFLQCYRLTLSDWWKKQFHHSFHGLIVGDNNFLLRYMQCHNLSARLAALKIWPSPELQHKSPLSAQSKDLIQVYPLTGCCLTV